MQEIKFTTENIREMMIARAKALLEDGTVTRVLGWTYGEFAYDVTPFMFKSAEELEARFVYNDFCGANLSKYLVAESSRDGKTLVFLKPCDTYSFNQLLTEHRIIRDKTYVIGVECAGKLDYEKIKMKGIRGLVRAEINCAEALVTVTDKASDKTFNISELLEERCTSCKSKKHVVYDELIGRDGQPLESNRFDMVEKLEKMSSEERFEFWQNELSRCIRCNACRKVCPACTCEKCVFDNDASGVAGKVNSDSFEEKMYHIIRAFHVAGRCTDCGECSRVCPENIPLHLLNRKFIKDINELYGDYQAGMLEGSRSPLVSYEVGDCEPSIVFERGGSEDE